MTQQKLEDKLYDLLIKNDEPFVAIYIWRMGNRKNILLAEVFFRKI
jgi:hypothetical protein